MWFFNSPNIVYGEDALDFLENIVGSKCFIVTDKNIQDIGYLKILTDKLEKLGKTYDVFNEVEPDPKEEIVLKAKETCLSYKPDLILALGGGSVIDTAKCVWAIYEFPEFGIDDLHIFNNDLYELGNKAKLIAIPTTSGTGADAVYSAIICRNNDGVWQKLIQAHRGLVPIYSILDPIFPTGMPLNLTLDTAVDILAHSIEALVANGRNEFGNALATKAIELVFEYLPIVYKDGNVYYGSSITVKSIDGGEVNVTATPAQDKNFDTSATITTVVLPDTIDLPTTEIIDATNTIQLPGSASSSLGTIYPIENEALLYEIFSSSKDGLVCLAPNSSSKWAYMMS